MNVRSLVTLLAVLVCGPLAAQPAEGLRLYVLDGGVLESDPSRYRLSADEVQLEPISVAAYLVVHPRGVLLWEAGAIADDERTVAEGEVERVVRRDGGERFVTLTRPLLAELAAAGYEPDDVTYLSFSHYHWDHTANANAFANATWLVRPIERQRMFAADPPGGTRPSTYSALANSRVVEITADEHDVFGDGSVVIMLAPGHSEGHQLLYVNLPRTGGVVLSGDLYHYPEERTLNRLPTFEVSEEQTKESREQLETFLDRTGAELWIQHDLAGHRALKHSPEYYD